MLNIELARIVAAERLRQTSESVRQGHLRRAVAERATAQAGSRPADAGSAAEPLREAGQRTKPALG